MNTTMPNFIIVFLLRFELFFLSSFSNKVVFIVFSLSTAQKLLLSPFILKYFLNPFIA